MELVVKRFDELTSRELYEILRIRVSVFVVEQQCPYQELDEWDLRAYHVFLRDDEGIQAYLRVLDSGTVFPEISLGRVLALRRRCGLGSRIVAAGLEVVRERMQGTRVRIEAQTYARGLYEKFGFRQVSEEFLEDGIPHIQMLLEWDEERPVSENEYSLPDADRLI